MNPPKHWKKLPSIIYPLGLKKIAAIRFVHQLIPDLIVLRSKAYMKDGSVWIHVSVSRRNRNPSWEEIMKVKNEFIGEDKEAYQVLSAKKDHVNLHPFCFHLWSRVDGEKMVANLKDIEKEDAF